MWNVECGLGAVPLICSHLRIRQSILACMENTPKVLAVFEVYADRHKFDPI
jgi:hypothetical protein